MSDQVSRRGFIKVLGGSAAAVAVGGGLVTSPKSVFAAPAARLLAQVQPGADPQADAVLAELAATEPIPYDTTVPRIARELPSVADATRSLLSKQGKPSVEQVGDVTHTVFAAPAPILLRIYKPAGTGPFPVMVYYHGGGWVIGTLNAYDGSARALTNAANAITVSVAYRNAPEAPFPGPVMDSFAAYKWVLENAASFGGDPNRVAVVGESAGGNLATVVSMMARDQGVKLPVHQTLIYPVTSTFYGQPEITFPSYAEFTNAMPLRTGYLAWFYKFYLRRAEDALNPYASPLRGNVAGLPSATVITAAIDPLRDEGEAYKDKLAQAGVQVDGMRYEGLTHEFFSMAGAVDRARQGVMDAAMSLKRAFGTA